MVGHRDLSHNDPGHPAGRLSHLLPTDENAGNDLYALSLSLLAFRSHHSFPLVAMELDLFCPAKKLLALASLGLIYPNLARVNSLDTQTEA